MRVLLTIICIAAPSLLVAMWLAAVLIRDLSPETQIALALIPLPLAALSASVSLIALTALWPHRAPALRRWAWLAPCIMAPTALIHPWTITPPMAAGRGIGFIEYFAGWLTKYPNFGPVNFEVLAGICALGVTAFGPPLFAALYLGRADRRVLATLAAIIAVAWAAVAWELDRYLVLTVLDETVDATANFLLYGPLARVLAVICVGVLTVRRFRNTGEWRTD